MIIRELIYLKAVVEEHSISKAAKKLYITQPSLSKCIKTIETNLGAKLFKRTNKGLYPTFAGEKFYEMANEIIRIYNNFEAEISDINNLKKGKIVIGCTVFYATFFLPVVIPSFKQKCPNIEIIIIEENSKKLEDILCSGEIDFAIMHIPPNYSTLDISKKANFYSLYKDEFILVTKKAHPLKQYAKNSVNSEYPEIDLALFATEPFITVKPGQRIRQITDMILNKADINPRISITTKSYETARRLACQGIGVTIIPKLYLNIFGSTDQGEYYSINKDYLPYWISCVAIKKDAYITKAAQLFINTVKEKLDSTLVNLKQLDNHNKF